MTAALLQLLLVITLVALNQFPVPGDAFVRKLLEAKLMASMIKELNSQSMHIKYVPYPIPIKLPPKKGDPGWSITTMPLMTRTNMIKTPIKSPMEMSRLEHLGHHYSALNFDHYEHDGYYDGPDETTHKHHRSPGDLHVFDGNHHDFTNFGLADHDATIALLNNMKKNLNAQAPALKIGELTARPWRAPTTELVKGNLAMDSFSMSGIGSMASDGLMMDTGITNFSDSARDLTYMHTKSADNNELKKITSYTYGNTTGSAFKETDLKVLLDKMKKLNTHEEMREIDEEQMKRLITENFEDDLENSEKKGPIEMLEELKSEKMDRLNLMKPFDAVKTPKTITWLPVKTAEKSDDNGKKKLLAQRETSRSQPNWDSPVSPFRSNTLKMALPQYSILAPSAQFNMKSPSAQIPTRNEGSQILLGRIRNAMGTLGLAGVRRGQSAKAINWNPLNTNMQRLNEMTLRMMNHGLPSSGQGMVLKSVIMPNNPVNAMDIYNSVPALGLRIHRDMEAMLLAGAKSHNERQVHSRPKKAVPTYLGVIQQGLMQTHNKENYEGNRDLMPQRQKLRNQMDKIMDEVTGGASRPRQNPYVPNQMHPKLTLPSEPSSFSGGQKPDYNPPGVVDLKANRDDLERLRNVDDRVKAVEKRAGEQSSIIAVAKHSSSLNVMMPTSSTTNA